MRCDDEAIRLWEKMTATVTRAIFLFFEKGTSGIMTATILVTGGCGYIGSHTLVCLLRQGYNAVVVDNLVNSSPVSLDRVAEIAGLSDEERSQRLIFCEVDICDKAALRRVFETFL